MHIVAVTSDRYIRNECAADIAGRDCTYYKAVSSSQSNTVHLVESEPDPPINMQNKRYQGVQIKSKAAAW